jgi:hypothetical protein
MRSLTGAVCIKLLTKLTIKGAHYRGISPMSIWRAVEIDLTGWRVVDRQPRTQTSTTHWIVRHYSREMRRLRECRGTRRRRGTRGTTDASAALFVACFRSRAKPFD